MTKTKAVAYDAASIQVKKFADSVILRQKINDKFWESTTPSRCFNQLELLIELHNTPNLRTKFELIRSNRLKDMIFFRNF